MHDLWTSMQPVSKHLGRIVHGFYGFNVSSIRCVPKKNLQILLTILPIGNKRTG